jgi:hypothetical protein
VRYMISEIQYGGRITDDWDRVQMNVFAEKFFKQEVAIIIVQRIVHRDLHLCNFEGSRSLCDEIHADFQSGA